MIISKKRFLPTNNSLTLQQGDWYFYLHSSVYAQAVLLRDSYNYDTVIELVGRENNRAAVEFFHNNAPKPIDIFAPLLGLVDEGLPTDDMEVLTGVLHVITSQIFAIKRWLEQPEPVKAAMEFTSNIQFEYQMAYERFFTEAVPYEERGLWRIPWVEALKQFKLLEPSGAIIGMGNADVNTVLSPTVISGGAPAVNYAPAPNYAPQQANFDPTAQATQEAVANGYITEYDGVPIDVNHPETIPWGAQFYDDPSKYDEDDRRHWDNMEGWLCTGPGVYYNDETDDMMFIEVEGEAEMLENLGDMSMTEEPEVDNKKQNQASKANDDESEFAVDVPVSEESNKTKRLMDTSWDV